MNTTPIQERLEEMKLINNIATATPLIRKGSEEYKKIREQVKEHILCNPSLKAAYDALYTDDTKCLSVETFHYCQWFEKWVDGVIDNACVDISREYKADGSVEVYGNYNARLACAAVQINLLGIPEIADSVKAILPADIESSCTFTVEEGRIHAIVKITGQNGIVETYNGEIRQLLRNWGYGCIESGYATEGSRSIAYFV